jgi:DnaK suppressor protein
VAAELRRSRAELHAEWEACLEDLQSDGGSHPDGDQPTERECSAFTIRTLEHLSQRIKEVDRALERLEIGLYGVCVECACPISKERLRANPLAARCISCQERVEKVGRRRAI